MNRLMKLNLCFATIITLVIFVACAKDEITSLTLNYTSLNFSIGQTDSLIAIIAGNGDIQKFPIDWSTSDSTVVTVVKGKIEAIAKGSAIITAKTGSKTASCTVTVTNQLYPVTTEGYLFTEAIFSMSAFRTILTFIWLVKQIQWIIFQPFIKRERQFACR